MRRQCPARTEAEPQSAPEPLDGARNSVDGSPNVGTLLVALVLFGLILVSLALFARGGPTETIRDPGGETSGVGRLTLPELASVTTRLFNELGFEAVSTVEQPGRCDVVLVDPTPITGQKVYARCVPIPETGAVQSAEVQAALDTARATDAAKAVVVTPGAFSDEARLLERGANLELLDGARLAELLCLHLPDVANRLGLSR